jgi:myo-inositol-1(or 4)-monophosphatase
MNVKEMIDYAIASATSAAEKFAEVHETMRTVERVEETGREVKLAADRILNNSILQALKSTNLPVLSEESSPDKPLQHGLQWVVDPLDGSVNFLRGIGGYCISIALVDGEKPIAGVIHDLSWNRTYATDVVDGVCICVNDGKPASCSTATDLSKSILCTGIPSRLAINSSVLSEFGSMFSQFQKIRMLGSACQSLLHVARGEADAYFERDIMIWDVAAGLALVRAAGGVWWWQQGSRTNSVTVWASAPGIFEEFRNLR